jgi:probable rRNA maturation factor
LVDFLVFQQVFNRCRGFGANFAAVMATLFHSIDSDFKVNNKRLLKAWIASVCQHFGKSVGEINIIVCSDEHLLGMNRSHLNHDYYTDIITFEYSTEPVSGDLYISTDRVKENASKYAVPIDYEFYRIVVHGVLHILGLKDKSAKDAEKMRENEDYFLQNLISLLNQNKK